MAFKYNSSTGGYDYYYDPNVDTYDVSSYYAVDEPEPELASVVTGPTEEEMADIVAAVTGDVATYTTSTSPTYAQAYVDPEPEEESFFDKAVRMQETGVTAEDQAAHDTMMETIDSYYPTESPPPVDTSTTTTVDGPVESTTGLDFGSGSVSDTTTTASTTPTYSGTVGTFTNDQNQLIGYDAGGTQYLIPEGTVGQFVDDRNRIIGYGEDGTQYVIQDNYDNIDNPYEPGTVGGFIDDRGRLIGYYEDGTQYVADEYYGYEGTFVDAQDRTIGINEDGSHTLLTSGDWSLATAADDLTARFNQYDADHDAVTNDDIWGNPDNDWEGGLFTDMRLFEQADPGAFHAMLAENPEWAVRYYSTAALDSTGQTHITNEEASGYAQYYAQQIGIEAGMGEDAHENGKTIAWNYDTFDDVNTEYGVGDMFKMGTAQTDSDSLIGDILTNPLTHIAANLISFGYGELAIQALELATGADEKFTFEDIAQIAMAFVPRMVPGFMEATGIEDAVTAEAVLRGAGTTAITGDPLEGAEAFASQWITDYVVSGDLGQDLNIDPDTLSIGGFGPGSVQTGALRSGTQELISQGFEGDFDLEDLITQSAIGGTTELGTDVIGDMFQTGDKDALTIEQARAHYGFSGPDTGFEEWFDDLLSTDLTAATELLDRVDRNFQTTNLGKLVGPDSIFGGDYVSTAGLQDLWDTGASVLDTVLSPITATLDALGLLDPISGAVDWIAYDHLDPEQKEQLATIDENQAAKRALIAEHDALEASYMNAEINDEEYRNATNALLGDASDFDDALGSLDLMIDGAMTKLETSFIRYEERFLTNHGDERGDADLFSIHEENPYDVTYTSPIPPGGTGTPSGAGPAGGTSGPTGTGDGDSTGGDSGTLPTGNTGTGVGGWYEDIFGGTSGGTSGGRGGDPDVTPNADEIAGANLPSIQDILGPTWNSPGDTTLPDTNTDPDTTLPDDGRQTDDPTNQGDLPDGDGEGDLPDGEGDLPDGEGDLPDGEGDLPDPEVPLPDPEEPLPDPEEPLPDPEEPLPDPEVPLPDPEVPLPDPEEPLPDPEVPLPDPEEPLPDPEEPLPDPEEPWDWLQGVMGAQGGAMAPVNVGSSPLAVIEMLLSAYDDETKGVMGGPPNDQSALISMLLSTYADPAASKKRKKGKKNDNLTNTEFEQIMAELQRMA